MDRQTLMNAAEKFGMENINQYRELVLSTGRVIEGERGVIGIDAELNTFTGYDAGLPVRGPALTQAEKLELADAMIARWSRFRNSVL